MEHPFHGKEKHQKTSDQRATDLTKVQGDHKSGIRFEVIFLRKEVRDQSHSCGSQKSK